LRKHQVQVDRAKKKRQVSFRRLLRSNLRLNVTPPKKNETRGQKTADAEFHKLAQKKLLYSFLNLLDSPGRNQAARLKRA
jgi:hypothetical protein